MRRTGLILVAVAVAAALSAPRADAKAAYVKKAQDAGHKELVVNCQSCHVAKLPSAKEHALNDSLGAFLDKKMKETKAKEMDLKWLKDYKPPVK